MEWDRERDRTQMKPILQTVSDKVDAIDTLMPKVDLFEMAESGERPSATIQSQR